MYENATLSAWRENGQTVGVRLSLANTQAAETVPRIRDAGLAQGLATVCGGARREREQAGY